MKSNYSKVLLFVENWDFLIYNSTMLKNKMTYYVQTFGCQMNVHESEKIAGVLVKLGYTLAETKEEADVVVINTCAIRENAEKKLESFIGSLKATKTNNKSLVVLGCVTQIEDNANELKRKFPFINLIMGTHNLYKFEELFNKAKQSKKTVVEIIDSRTENDLSESLRTSGVNAWVNITHGCNNYCTYCIVPYTRGREISRSEDEIICEVKGLLEKGYKQITLLGQNVNSYGNDLNDKNVNFPNLLKKIDSIEGKFRIRFMTSHPKDLSDELIEVMANSKHICHGLHLPVQSGSSEVLNKMNRRYTREHYLQLVEKIRKAMPDIELTTDIIVGFVGETESQFEETLSLVKLVKYQQIFSFAYSKRKGTVAYSMEGHLPERIKKERLSKLIDIEREISTEVSNKYIGKTLEVLIEGINKNNLVGTTEFGKNINIAYSGDKEKMIGQFVNTKVTKAKLSVLYGEIK